MVLRAESKIGSYGNGGWRIYIPYLLRSDSQMPFSLGDLVEVRIENDRIVVEKLGAV